MYPLTGINTLKGFINSLGVKEWEKKQVVKVAVSISVLHMEKWYWATPVLKSLHTKLKQMKPGNGCLPTFKKHKDKKTA